MSEYEPHDKAEQEIDKMGMLAKRRKEKEEAVLTEMAPHLQEHNRIVDMINQTGINDPSVDPFDIGITNIWRIEKWYGAARKEAYAISGLCRELQKYYEGLAEQGQANQYELVKTGKGDNPKLNNSTDAQYSSRRIKGRLLEYAASYEGKFKRWHGWAETYEQEANSMKDILNYMKDELNRDRNVGQGR
jgi:hypothetical protein